jgi:hypothetical protein
MISSGMFSANFGLTVNVALPLWSVPVPRMDVPDFIPPIVMPAGITISKVTLPVGVPPVEEETIAIRWTEISLPVLL